MHKLSLGGILLATSASLAAQSTSGYLVDSNLDQLFSVDLATGAATLIAGTLNNGLDTPAGLTWRQATQELWTIDLNGGEVGTIDVLTGTFTAVFQTSLSGWQDIAWDAGNQVFFLANQNGNNYRLDPLTGTTTLLGAAGVSLITSLDIDATGALVGIDFNGAVVSVDKATGAATTLSTTLGGFQGLGIDQTTGVWYGANTNTDALHTIDPLTGVNAVVGPNGAGVQFAKGFDLIDVGGGNFATAIRFGEGCNKTFASFLESFTAFDLNNSTLLFVPTGNGYVVLPQAGTANWHTPSGGAQVIGDDQVLPFALGWTLPYPGGTTTDVYVSSNGFVHGVPNTASGCCAFNSTQFLTTGAVWSALWHDLNPSAGGTVTFETNATTGDAYVTFDQVPQYNTSNLNTFQFAFHSTGQVEILWQNCAVSACTVGWSPGQANLAPPAIDISAASAITTAPDTQPLSLSSSARPVLGTTINLVVGNVPVGTPIGAVIYGLGKFDPGISLTGIGMPDCFRFCTPDSSSLTIAPVGTFSSPFSLPNNVAFAGVHIIAQGAIYNPAGNHNQLGALSSNGVDLGLDVN